jgi:hypothetical protein
MGRDRRRGFRTLFPAATMPFQVAELSRSVTPLSIKIACSESDSYTQCGNCLAKALTPP